MTASAAIETPVKRKEAPEVQEIGKPAHYPSPTFAPMPAMQSGCGLASGHLVLENMPSTTSTKKNGSRDGGGIYLQG